jgi:curved DNA-binding protein CbpA
MDTYINFYEVLQISPEAEPETVQRVYHVLAARFHPDNLETGDVERFLEITKAYQVLNNPVSRASFDSEHRSRRNAPHPVFMSREFSAGMESETKIRLGMLCLLYAKRRANINAASMTVIDLESVMGIPREHLMFSSWYLKSKKFAVMDDRSSLTITADGVDFLEVQLPSHQKLYDAFRGPEATYYQMPALKSGETAR